VPPWAVFRYGNRMVKKIPRAVLTRCEWGKGDYSRKVENLPKAPPPKGQMDLILLNGDEAKQLQTTSDKDALPEAT